MKTWIAALSLALALMAPQGASAAALRVSKQYGVGYLPLIVLEEQKLVEKNARKAGLGDVQVTWVTLSGGAASNDALLSGSVDFISLGTPPFIRLWEKTNGQVKAIAVLGEFAPALTTNNPNVKTIKDFTDKDRIGVPAVKISVHSLLLQMAVAKEYGIQNYDKLDPLTIAIRHPDGLIALSSGKSELTAHFTQEPFLSAELKLPGVRKILDGYDILGGHGTYLVVAGATKFYENNRQLCEIFHASVEEATTWINAHKEEAAALYVKAAKTKETPQDILNIINDPRGGFFATPRKTTVFSDFLYSAKAIKTKPGTWKDLYFPVLHSKQGS